MTLQNKYRPETLEEFYGNNEIVAAMGKVFQRPIEDIPHSYLFVGLAGGGKTTLAYILKNLIKCSDGDFKYFNASNTNGIPTVREVAEDMSFAPMYGKAKMYVFDECHRMSPEARDALLLMTENPPDHVYFVLCTSEPFNLTDATKRRLHIYKVNPMDYGELNDLCIDIIEAEEMNDFPQEVLDAIVNESKGSAGVALKLLDTVKDSYTNIPQAVKLIELNMDEVDAETLELCQALILNLTPEQKWNKCKIILKKIKKDPETVRYAIIGYLNKVMLNNGDLRTAMILECFLENFYSSKAAGLTHAVFTACQG
jgi:DNA polymerase III gamma/tau subunit